MLSICTIYFFRISIIVSKLTSIAMNIFKKQWHFKIEVNIFIRRSIQSIWNVILQIKSSNKELSKCHMIYHHWAPTRNWVCKELIDFPFFPGTEIIKFLSFSWHYWFTVLWTRKTYSFGFEYGYCTVCEIICNMKSSFRCICKKNLCNYRICIWILEIIPYFLAF